ncbi:MAG TPA: family 10 glycosylhydrolase [Longimicrobiales bacterium]
MRALWVVRNTLAHPDSARAMVRRAQAAGFNTLIVQVRGGGDASYDSRWEPKPPAIAQRKGYDPLALVIGEAHKRGMTVHAWLNTIYLTGMDRPNGDAMHFYNQHPDALAVPYPIARELYAMDPKDPKYRDRILEYSKTARDRVEGVYACAAAPELKEHLYSVWMDVLEKYDVDGLNFDFVRYPAPEYDYARASLDRFRAWLLPQLGDSARQRLAELARTDPLVYADSFQGRYADFRRQQITDVVERIYYGVKKRAPDVVVSADVFPGAQDAYEHRYQDWTEWLRRGIIDIAAPMTYTTNTDTYRTQVKAALEVGGPERIWAGVGSWRMPVAGTVEKIKVARELGARGIVLFSYDSAVRKGDNNPDALYLQHVAEQAFKP